VDLAGLLRLGHALAGTSFVAGLVGFWIVTGRASHADSLATMRLLLRVAEPFGRLVTASGISLTFLGIATAIAIGRPLFGPLQGGSVDWMFVSVLLMLPIFGFLVLVYPRFGRRIREALLAADADARITPELTAAWADPTYRFARRYELVAVVVVLALMIAKPF
jgi:Predicted integral membrane protein (DUF2269)